MWFRNQLIPLTLVIFLIVSHSSGDRGQWSKPLVGDGKESSRLLWPERVQPATDPQSLVYIWHDIFGTLLLLPLLFPLRPTTFISPNLVSLHLSTQAHHCTHTHTYPHTDIYTYIAHFISLHKPTIVGWYHFISLHKPTIAHTHTHIYTYITHCSLTPPAGQVILTTLSLLHSQLPHSGITVQCTPLHSQFTPHV